MFCFLCFGELLGHRPQAEMLSFIVLLTIKIIVLNYFSYGFKIFKKSQLIVHPCLPDVLFISCVISIYSSQNSYICPCPSKIGFINLRINEKRLWFSSD